MKLYNTLHRKIEEFEPIKEGFVGVYSCGPTVYWNQHIGHMYAFTQWDVLVRALHYLGYQVKWVMNITDVGHMTSEEDAGEDKMEKGAKREGLSVWDLANKYITQFVESMDALNIHPDILARATENIPEQIDLIKKIEARGFTYKTNMGLVFDTAKFPDYAKFANLDLKKMQSTGRQEADPEKKRPWDFFLWVTGQPSHIMQWDSPWGRGFPGWHIECTAMSTKFLGERFDIHTGGIEHVPVHHTNEIAQAYGAFGAATANFWLHNSWLTGKGGEKMSKSLGNFVTVQELVAKGYDPLAHRYLVMTSNYRKGLNFSWDALDAAVVALNRLRENVAHYKRYPEEFNGNGGSTKTWRDYENDFRAAIEDDLNVPAALAVVWGLVDDKGIINSDKLHLILDFDRVLGLKLEEVPEETETELPYDIRELVEKREEARRIKDFDKADKIREQIEKLGYTINDRSDGRKVFKKL